jgi:cobalamin biosynthesis protein CobD/CbiB
MNAPTLLAALVADVVLSRWALGRRGPTAWVLDGVAQIERRLNRPHRPPADRRVRGALVLLLTVAGAALAGAWFEGLVVRGGTGMRFGQLILVMLMLDAGTPTAAAHRQAATLPDDDHAAARGAVERLALRLGDGAAGPILAYLLFGLGGLAAWRAVVLLERGLAGHAPFDATAVAAYRLLLWPAGLIAGLLVVAATVVVPGASTRGALAALSTAPALAARAAYAGAFGWSLGDGRGSWVGPRDGRARLGPEDVRRAAGATTVAVLVAAGGVLVLALHA